MRRTKVEFIESYIKIDDADYKKNVPNDAISHKQAIEAMGEPPLVWTGDDEYAMGQLNMWEEAVKALRELPPVEPEIIRKPVIGYEGYYEVDNCGRVYALDRVIHVEDHGRSYDKPLAGRIIKQHMLPKDIKLFHLQKMGRQKTISFTE